MYEIKTNNIRKMQPQIHTQNITEKKTQQKKQIFWRYFLPLTFSILKQNTVENYPHKPQKSYPKKEHKSDKY